MDNLKRLAVLAIVALAAWGAWLLLPDEGDRGPDRVVAPPRASLDPPPLPPSPPAPPASSADEPAPEALDLRETPASGAPVAESSPSSADPAPSEQPGAEAPELPPAEPQAAIAARVGTLRGRVVDAFGRGIPGAAVRAVRRQRNRGGEPVEARASEGDEPGRFVLALVPGDYAVRASTPRHIPAGARARVAAGETAEVEVRLEEGGEIAGSVLEDGPLAAIAGARITIIHRETGDRRRIRTDDRGRFTATGLREGAHALAASAEGFVPIQVEASVERARGATLSTIALRRGGSLGGRISDAEHRPVPGALVYVLASGESYAEVTADAEGRYEASGLAGGTYHVFARTEDYALSSREETVVIEGSARTELDIVLAPGAAIAGRVSGPGDVPLEGVVVVADAEGEPVQREGRTDASGRYRVPNLYAGAYRVRVQREGAAEGLAPARGRVEVAAGEEVTLDLALGAGSTVRGRVFKPGGDPAVRAWVFALLGSEYRGQARADRQGRYEIAGLAPGDYVVYARTDDFSLLVNQALRVGEGASLDPVDVTLGEGASVSGRVLDPDGQPLAGVAVRLSTSGAVQVRRSDRTDEQGAFTLEHLYDGPYTIAVDPESAARALGLPPPAQPPPSSEGEASPGEQPAPTPPAPRVEAPPVDVVIARGRSVQNVALRVTPVTPPPAPAGEPPAPEPPSR